MVSWNFEDKLRSTYFFLSFFTTKEFSRVLSCHAAVSNASLLTTYYHTDIMLTNSLFP